MPICRVFSFSSLLLPFSFSSIKLSARVPTSSALKRKPPRRSPRRPPFACRPGRSCSQRRLHLMITMMVMMTGMMMTRRERTSKEKVLSETKSRSKEEKALPARSSSSLPRSFPSVRSFLFLHLHHPILLLLCLCLILSFFSLVPATSYGWKHSSYHRLCVPSLLVLISHVSVLFVSLFARSLPFLFLCYSPCCYS